MKAKENPGMTFERFIEAVMACEIVLLDYYDYILSDVNDTDKLEV